MSTGANEVLGSQDFSWISYMLMQCSTMHGYLDETSHHHKGVQNVSGAKSCLLRLSLVSSKIIVSSCSKENGDLPYETKQQCVTGILHRKRNCACDSCLYIKCRVNFWSRPNQSLTSRPRYKQMQYVTGELVLRVVTWQEFLDGQYQILSPWNSTTSILASAFCSVLVCW